MNERTHLDFESQRWRLRSGEIVDVKKIHPRLPVTFSGSSTDHRRSVFFHHSTKGIFNWNALGDCVSCFAVDKSPDNFDMVQRVNSISPDLDPALRVTVVTGGNSGLGLALCRELKKVDGQYVVNLDMDSADSLHPADVSFAGQLPRPFPFLQQELDLLPRVDTLINCAGLNRIGYLEDFEENAWEAVMDINAKAIYYLSRLLLPRLRDSGGTILNIVSNAAHVPMTGSLAYNASKGAAWIMTLQLARELTRRHGITVFGVAPNKMAGTKMSRYIESRVPEVRGWTREQADEYQKQSLLTGEETPPESVAEFIAFLLSTKERHKHLTGCILPYGA